MELEFESDPAETEANLRSRGVSFAAASSALHDPLSLTLPDPDHSGHEEWSVLLGCSNAGRRLAVAHTEPGDRIRIVSAPLPMGRERRQYVQGSE